MWWSEQCCVRIRIDQLNKTEAKKTHTFMVSWFLTKMPKQLIEQMVLEELYISMRWDLDPCHICRNKLEWIIVLNLSAETYYKTSRRSTEEMWLCLRQCFLKKTQWAWVIREWIFINFTSSKLKTLKSVIEEQQGHVTNRHAYWDF